MYSKALESYKKNLSLTKSQKEILVGLMLGDGHLETMNRGRTYRLKVEHSIKQKDYVDWLYGMFKEWVRKPPVVREKFVFGRKFVNYYFSTYSSGKFRFYGQQFYRDGKKVIPKMIAKLFSPLALAVWFMDDGSIKSKKHKTKLINTQSFSLQDLKRLQRALKDKFGIITTRKKERTGWRLYILSESIRKFEALINPYVIPSMRYKLG